MSNRPNHVSFEKLDIFSQDPTHIILAYHIVLFFQNFVFFITLDKQAQLEKKIKYTNDALRVFRKLEIPESYIAFKNFGPTTSIWTVFKVLGVKFSVKKTCML